MDPVTRITDDVVETWKAMPLMFGYDVDARAFVAIKNYQVTDAHRLTQQLSVTKDVVDAACARHGEQQGIRLVRLKAHSIINERIEKLYKGQNKPIS